MNAKGHLPVNFEERLTIIHCPSREAKLLKLREDEGVVFHFECLGRDASGQMVEYSHSYIRTTNMKFRFYQCKRSF